MSYKSRVIRSIDHKPTTDPTKNKGVRVQIPITGQPTIIWQSVLNKSTNKYEWKDLTNYLQVIPSNTYGLC